MSEQPRIHSIPLACTVQPANVSARLSSIQQLFSGATAVTPLPAGYAFAFPGERVWLERIAVFIAQERECCAFFDFSLHVPPAGGAFRLEITGGEGVKEIIADFLPEARQ